MFRGSFWIESLNHKSHKSCFLQNRASKFKKEIGGIRDIEIRALVAKTKNFARSVFSSAKRRHTNFPLLFSPNRFSAKILMRI